MTTGWERKHIGLLLNDLTYLCVEFFSATHGRLGIAVYRITAIWLVERLSPTKEVGFGGLPGRKSLNIPNRAHDISLP